MHGVAKTKAQAAADAAALAGASAFLGSAPSETEARSRAIHYVTANSTDEIPVTLQPQDIVIDMTEGTIEVKVGARAYGLPAVLAWILGVSRVEEFAQATAQAQSVRCLEEGLAEDGVPIVRCVGRVKTLSLIE